MRSLLTRVKPGSLFILSFSFTSQVKKALFSAVILCDSSPENKCVETF